MDGMACSGPTLDSECQDCRILSVLQSAQAGRQIMIVQFKRLFTLASHLTTLSILSFITYRLWSNLRFLNWARRRASHLPMSTPRVSVLIPARNETTTIATCVDSLIRQEYPNIEFIAL